MVAIETQVDVTKEMIGGLIEEIKAQPMSAREASELRQQIKEKQDTRLTLKQRVEEARQGVFDLQRRHGNMVSQVDAECKEVNDVLRRLSGIVPDGGCIPILDYNSSKRADPTVLRELTQQTRDIKVCGYHYCVSSLSPSSPLSPPPGICPSTSRENSWGTGKSRVKNNKCRVSIFIGNVTWLLVIIDL